jgi:hypothetical protein
LHVTDLRRTVPVSTVFEEPPMSHPDPRRRGPGLSIKSGTAPDRSAIPPVPHLSPEQIGRIREVAQRSRAEHPIPPGVAVRIVLGR